MTTAQTTQQLFGVMQPPSVEPKTEDIAVAGAGEALVDTVALEDFELHDKLGAGGNATVYVATWKKTGERVALKIIHGELSQDPKYLARFHREVRSASRLKHPNICRVLAYGTTAEKQFLAMELIEGGSLRDLIDRSERLPPQVAAALLVQLLDALGCAHDAGILHRDVKPANAMVTREGVLKLVDFGIAKGRDDATVTETGFLVGTPAYMSPEQAVGKEIDARTDLYAVGVCFYEMLIGENPYANDNPSQALLRIASEQMPSVFEQDATIPGAVESVLERLVERNRDLRYATAREAITELRPYLAFVDEVHPTLLKDYVANPAFKQVLIAEQAELELARAERLLLAGEVNLPAAALALFRAQCLTNTIQIAHRFEHVCSRGAFRFGAVDDDALLKIRQAIVESPNPAGPLKRAADLYRARGDIHRAVVFLRRYLREKPSDSQAAHQLELLVAGVAAPAMSAAGKMQTIDILAGVKTGGWAAVSPDRKAEALALQQPKASVRSPRVAPGSAGPPARPPPPPNTEHVKAAGLPTADVADPKADIKVRIAAAAVKNARPMGARAADDDDGLAAIVSSMWERFGRQLAVGAVLLVGFAVVAWWASGVIDLSVNKSQQVMGDNAAAIGAIERNDIARVQENTLKDAVTAENAGECLKAINHVTRLQALKPPAALALNGLLIRGRCRLQINQREAARRDFEEFLQQTPLSDARRATVKAQLDGL
ncbi:MAG: serine/threonine-protein kinase [Deltaproteobacteria bacterium]|nr:serine/threonine-protein kinase [Deltaproteobacteria bacterium]